MKKLIKNLGGRRVAYSLLLYVVCILILEQMIVMNVPQEKMQVILDKLFTFTNFAAGILMAALSFGKDVTKLDEPTKKEGE